MIPILYDSNETAFVSNGLCRLKDVISCTVTEERNSIYECDFEYPVTGANYDLIQCGRIIAVTHDETGDIQPFDIVSFSRPINGVVTFHAVHISYRQSKLTVSGTNISSLTDALTLLTTAKPTNPFGYWTDKTSDALFLRLTVFHVLSSKCWAAQRVLYLIVMAVSMSGTSGQYGSGMLEDVLGSSPFAMALI